MLVTPRRQLLHCAQDSAFGYVTEITFRPFWIVRATDCEFEFVDAMWNANL